MGMANLLIWSVHFKFRDRVRFIAAGSTCKICTFELLLYSKNEYIVPVWRGLTQHSFNNKLIQLPLRRKVQIAVYV